MPTFADCVVDELARSGFLERLQPLGKLFSEVQKMLGAMFLMARAIPERAEENFPSKAYGPYLEAQGFSPFLAGDLAAWPSVLGQRHAKEAKRVARVVEAIRFLARGDRQKRAILSKAKLVLAASKETSIVDELFSNASLHEGGFLRLLQTVIDGGAIDRKRIRTIAAAIAPSLSPARGPKISAASAAHEQFLETHAYLGRRAGYTWSEYKGNFVDPRTQATRQEFGDRGFDPRPAYRRVKRRGLVKTGSSRSLIG